MLAETDYASLALRTAALVGVVIVLFLAVTAVRKWLKDDTSATVGTGFSLSDLRQLHHAGKMTTEEFEKAKAIIRAAYKPVEEKKSTDDPQV
ncbi:hypothetical protein BH10PLA1_BH10PLA1_19360 [soil metagenome]